MVTLTSNERKVIQLLLENGSISNTEICSKLKISKQAVGRIRKKLEDNKVIKGYSISLDLRRLGIDVLCFVKLHPKVDNTNFNSEIKNLIGNEPQIIRACKVIVSKPTIILLCGFNNLDTAALFVNKISDNGHLTIEEILIFKPDDILTDSYHDLINRVLRNYNEHCSKI